MGTSNNNDEKDKFDDQDPFEILGIPTDDAPDDSPEKSSESRWYTDNQPVGQEDVETRQIPVQAIPLPPANDDIRTVPISTTHPSDIPGEYSAGTTTLPGWLPTDDSFFSGALFSLDPSNSEESPEGSIDSEGNDSNLRGNSATGDDQASQPVDAQHSSDKAPKEVFSPAAKDIAQGIKLAFSEILPQSGGFLKDFVSGGIVDGVRHLVNHEPALITKVVDIIDGYVNSKLPKLLPYNEIRHWWNLVRHELIVFGVMFVVTAGYGLVSGQLGWALVGFILLFVISMFGIGITINHTGIGDYRPGSEGIGERDLKDQPIPKGSSRWAILPAGVGITVAVLVFGALMTQLTGVIWGITAVYLLTLGLLVWWAWAEKFKWAELRFVREGRTMFARRRRNLWFLCKEVKESLDLIDVTNASIGKTSLFAQIFGCYTISNSLNTMNKDINTKFWEEMKDVKNGSYLVDVLNDGRTVGRADAQTQE